MRRFLLAAALGLNITFPAAVPPASPVNAVFSDGQTFVTWPDQATGSAGNNWRYSMYRSTSPITSANCESGTLIASHIFNNSAQLFGGTPNGTGATFTQANRQNATGPMAILSFGGLALPTYSGLQVYTATATQNAYYCIEANPQPSGSDVFLGSAGPMAETAATIPTPIKYADSLSRGQTYGKINCSSSCGSIPTILVAHASEASGGPPPDNQYGDYWEFFGTAADGYQDGRQTTFDVLEDGVGGTTWPGQANALVISPRDTWWTTDGSAGLETFHQGVGMTPNPLVGSANEMYLSTANGYNQFLNFAISHYGANSNNIQWTGQSMGAWGGANTGLHMTSPEMAGLWLFAPMWRMDHRSNQAWAGDSWSNVPFKATLGTAPATMGANAAAINLNTGPTWGGSGGYVDEPTFLAANPGTDLPFIDFAVSAQDGFALWSDEVAAINALETAHRGFVATWDQGGHNEASQWGLMGENINCNNAPAASFCYHMNTFQLNVPYLALSNSSIDDNWGTATVQPNGLFDGDQTGCANCGFSWTIPTDSSGAFNFTISNGWMGLSPTLTPTTTISSNIPATGTGTFTVTSTASLQPVSPNLYFLVSNTEVLKVSNITGSTVTYTARGQLGTTTQAHTSGDAIVQFMMKPTGPNHGPFSAMTVDVTPRRRQHFLPTPTTVVTCTVTPFGGSPTTINATVDSNSNFDLVGVPINSGGATSANCT